MSHAAQIVGFALAVIALLAALWRGARALHRFANLVEGVGDRLAKLEKSLNNGIRSDVSEAKEKASEAARLAGQAAQRASVVDQRAEEGRHELQRAINALRGEVDIFTNVVLSDRARIRSRLREMGLDIGDDDDV